MVSPEVNCVGDFVFTTSCSASCGNGTQTGYYVQTTAAAYGGTECPYAVGVTETQTCNTLACRTFCVFSLCPYLPAP